VIVRSINPVFGKFDEFVPGAMAELNDEEHAPENDVV
jgi:hypothetical protein